MIKHLQHDNSGEMRNCRSWSLLMRKEKVQLFSASHVVRQPRQMTKKAFVGVNIIYASVIFAFVASSEHVHFP